ncbi:hypothetical protein GCM10023350_28460 [Nocardioides endophyticus]|uniref:DUF559 domain-containing protein n=1 Tax=Nocardioides endophyticus TaxID=1353775 RepID=A0ABP8Z041_9ACTN
MRHRPWQVLADAQAGLVSRRQLNHLGVDRYRVRNQVSAERWVERSSMVVSTTTGPLSREQLMWLGVLHAGPRSALGDLTAADVCGLRHWHRELITVVVPQKLILEDEPDGIRFVRTRRPIPLMVDPAQRVPAWRIEPAVLHFAAYQPSRRTAQGVVAAAVQQRLTTPGRLIVTVEQMQPLRWAKMFRQVIGDIAGGSHSVAELDILRLCRSQRLRPPDRQVQRRDGFGRPRFTDCEWDIGDGRVLVLEVDGAFHMDVEHWEDDIARQRGITDPNRIVVRCTSREVRDEQDRLGADLRRLGVPGRVA